jgi:hypothetical protein
LLGSNLFAEDMMWGPRFPSDQPKTVLISLKINPRYADSATTIAGDCTTKSQRAT